MIHREAWHREADERSFRMLEEKAKRGGPQEKREYILEALRANQEPSRAAISSEDVYGIPEVLQLFRENMRTPQLPWDSWLWKHFWKWVHTLKHVHGVSWETVQASPNVPYSPHHIIWHQPVWWVQDVDQSDETPETSRYAGLAEDLITYLHKGNAQYFEKGESPIGRFDEHPGYILRDAELPIYLQREGYEAGEYTGTLSMEDVPETWERAIFRWFRESKA